MVARLPRVSHHSCYEALDDFDGLINCDPNGRAECAWARPGLGLSGFADHDNQLFERICLDVSEQIENFVVHSMGLRKEFLTLCPFQLVEIRFDNAECPRLFSAGDRVDKDHGIVVIMQGVGKVEATDAEVNHVCLTRQFELLQSARDLRAESVVALRSVTHATYENG